MRIGLLILVCLVLFISHLGAQSLDNIASTYEGENGKGYMQPLGDSFGAALNAGLYQAAVVPRSGFHLRLGIHTMTAFVGNDQKTFEATTQGNFAPQQTVEAPTVFGSTEGVSVAGVAETGYLFPGGMDVQRLPIAVPQLTLGSVYGTELTLRFLQMDLDDNFKELSLVGYGLRHSISQYFKLLPVDLTAAVMLQKFNVGDIVQADALYFGVQASRSFGLTTLYGGLGYGSSNTNIEYELETDEAPQTISFDLDAAASPRLNAGVLFKLGPLYLHADYNLGAQSVLALGCGLGI